VLLKPLGVDVPFTREGLREALTALRTQAVLAAGIAEDLGRESDAHELHQVAARIAEIRSMVTYELAEEHAGR